MVTSVVQAGGEEGGREPPPPGLLLLLARVCAFMEGTAVVHVMETLAAAFPGRGGGSGGDEPPAFVAGEIARCARRTPASASECSDDAGCGGDSMGHRLQTGAPAVGLGFRAGHTAPMHDWPSRTRVGRRL